MSGFIRLLLVPGAWFFSTFDPGGGVGQMI